LSSRVLPPQPNPGLNPAQSNNQIGWGRAAAVRLTIWVVQVMLIEQQTIASGSITVPGTYLCQSCIDDQPQSTDWKVSFPSIIAILGARRRLAPLELPLPANILVPWEFSTLNLTQSSSGFFPFSPGTRYLISPAPPPLGWLFHERTRILSGIHFTRHFIEFVVVETKLFVGSNVTVILTRPVLDQATQSKRRSVKIILTSEFAICF